MALENLLHAEITAKYIALLDYRVKKLKKLEEEFTQEKKNLNDKFF